MYPYNAESDGFTDEQAEDIDAWEKGGERIENEIEESFNKDESILDD